MRGRHQRPDEESRRRSPWTAVVEVPSQAHRPLSRGHFNGTVLLSAGRGGVRCCFSSLDGAVATPIPPLETWLPVVSN